MSESSREKQVDAAAELPGPSTNREAVPAGLEGSIMEPDGARDSRHKPSPDSEKVGADRDDKTDRAEGNDRRTDDS